MSNRAINDFKKINRHRRVQFVRWFFEDVDNNNLRYIIRQAKGEKNFKKQLRMFDSIVKTLIENRTGVGQKANFGYILYKNKQWHTLTYVREWVLWYCFRLRR